MRQTSSQGCYRIKAELCEADVAKQNVIQEEVAKKNMIQEEVRRKKGRKKERKKEGKKEKELTLQKVVGQWCVRISLVHMCLQKPQKVYSVDTCFH